jgi:DNA gyrase subunit A
MMMTNSGKVIRTRIQEVSVISRNTQGVTLMDVEVGERIVGAARLAEREDDEGPGPEAEGTDAS